VNGGRGRKEQRVSVRIIPLVFRPLLAERSSAATTNLMVAAVRGVLRACRRLGLISGDDYANAVDLKPIRGERDHAATGRALSQQDLNRLMGG
jgi:predicted nucleic acid-binding protein